MPGRGGVFQWEVRFLASRRGAVWAGKSGEAAREYARPTWIEVARTFDYTKPVLYIPTKNKEYETSMYKIDRIAANERYPNNPVNARPLSTSGTGRPSRSGIIRSGLIPSAQ